MTQELIVYPYPDGGIVVLHTVTKEDIHVVAQRDVPKDIPYIIINIEDLPKDRDFRSAWDADFSNPDGYGLGFDEWYKLNSTDSENTTDISENKV